jgi:putative toxin-antitoxin system antitoxin component (TIGR02293 family)
MARRTETARVVDLLGGRRTLGSSPKTDFDFIGIVRRGLPYKALERALAALDVPSTEVFRVLRLPARTLARRKQGRALSQTESERVLRFVRLFARAAAVLGDPKSAIAWLRTPNRALGSAPPEDFLDTDIGAQSVGDVLGRIEQSVYG